MAVLWFSAPQAAVPSYTIDTASCPGKVSRITVTAADPQGRRYRITGISTKPDIVGQATALAVFLGQKMADPTAPSFDATGAYWNTSPLNWFVLGKSAPGAGC